MNELLAQVVPVGLNTDEQEGKEMSDKWGVQGIPAILFLDADGNEVHRFVGFRSPDEFVTEFETAMKAKG